MKGTAGGGRKGVKDSVVYCLVEVVATHGLPTWMANHVPCMCVLLELNIIIVLVW